MEFRKFEHTEKRSQLFLTISQNVEQVNPIEKIMNDIIDSYIGIKLSEFEFAFENKSPSPFDKLTRNQILRALEKKGLLIWGKKYEKIMQSVLSEDIYKILQCSSKDFQVKFFKPPFEFTSNTLHKFIFQAWLRFGYKYSAFRFEFPQTGIKLQDFPSGYIFDDDENLEIYGQTNLSKGILKNAIKHRKVTIAKLIEKGSEWHCFYYNYNSIYGREVNNNPHIHYISNNWMIDKNIILKELQNRHHKFTSEVHIKFSR